MPMLKIYGRANSINVRKVLWTCEEIGIPFEREDWGRGTRPVSDPEFLAINPFGVVPAIDDDGFRMGESHAIARYLVMKHGRDDLLPTGDLQKRALVEMWMEWQGTEVANAHRAVVTAHVFKIQVPGGQAAIDASLKEWPERMKVIEARLGETGAYITGPDFTLADVCIGLTVNRWFMTPTGEKPAFPAMSAYYDRLNERPGFQMYGRNGTP
jgi:glutathione S-transferase